MRIVVADDHPLILAGFSALIQDRPEFEVIARCARGDDALRIILDQHPELAVLDLNMPGRTGLAIAQAVSGGPTRIVLISAMITPVQMTLARSAGVAGVILKDAAPDELISCLLRVASGGEWTPASSPRADAQPLPPAMARRLTARETEVAGLAALGLSNKSIARRLDLSDGTVKIHMYNVFRKTGLHNRTELANFINQAAPARFDLSGND
jgi:DNA-binding NarL/FixJ family response regulator